ncbi:transglycosylase SLT domain-containing protein [Mycobacteroides abscessus subsp. abscessus]|nr:transglycosylase SLT domain-containing protein [Mycobacteroides abscessus subsp. abscessus]
MAPLQSLGGIATPLTGLLGTPAKIIGPVLGGLGSFIQPGTYGGAGAPAIGGGGSGLASAMAGSGTGLGTNSAAAIAPGDVRFDKVKFPGGRAAVNAYIDQALDAHGITDPAARARWKSLLPVGIERESGFDPLAVNKTDSNAHGARQIDGAPFNSSRSLMQTIPTTYAANHQPGTSNYIYDPVSNIAAGMNYLMRRYNVGRGAERLTSVGQFNPHHSAGGY